MIDSSEQETLITHRTSCIQSLFDILVSFLSFFRFDFLLVCFLVVIVIIRIFLIVNYKSDIF